MLQFFLGGVPAIEVAAEDTYIFTPAAVVDRMDFGVGAGGVGPTYIFTPLAIGGLVRDVAAHSTYIFTAADGTIQTSQHDAQVTYIFTPLATSDVDHLVGVGTGDEGPTYIFTPEAVGPVDFLVAAENTYIFTPDSSARHVENGVAAVTYIFTPDASATVDFSLVIAGDDQRPTYIFTPEATGYVPDPHRGTQVTYIFTATTSAVVVAQECTPLGRYRRGDVVTLQLELPYIPDRSPVAVVLDQDERVVETLLMARSPVNPGLFARELFVGQAYLLGHYEVVFVVQAAGFPRKQLDQCFAVIGGGDAGGPVISLVSFQRGPGGQGQSVLAHLGSGELVLGRNPSLDLTPASIIPPAFQVPPPG